MRSTLLAPLLACCVVGFASAQTSHLVGSVYPQLPNTCGSGTPVFDVAIHYPALAAGLSLPVEPRVGGWPVIVFLHGYNLLGLDYDDLGKQLASNGFAVVMLNTARTDFITLDEDARSLPDALSALNADPGHVLGGALDLDHMGLMGHSMGGGVAGMALARSDYYRCGLALAPVFPGQATASLVEVPFGIVVGTGDAATPLLWHSLPYYQSLGTANGLRFLYAMNGAADHLNIAGLAASAQSPIFRRSVQISAGFFNHFLCGDQFAMERCLGDSARLDPHLYALEKQVFVPQTWVSAPVRIGRSVRISVASMDGLGAVLAAASSVVGLPTPFGLLYLDPASTFTVALALSVRERRLDVLLSVPPNPALVGTTIALQGLGIAVNDPLLLGSAVQLTVGH